MERYWRTWPGHNGETYAWLMGSSPPVVVHAPTARDLAWAIVGARAELDEGTYWQHQLSKRDG